MLGGAAAFAKRDSLFSFPEGLLPGDLEGVAGSIAGLGGAPGGPGGSGSGPGGSEFCLRGWDSNLGRKAGSGLLLLPAAVASAELAAKATAAADSTERSW